MCYTNPAVPFAIMRWDLGQSSSSVKWVLNSLSSRIVLRLKILSLKQSALHWAT